MIITFFCQDNFLNLRILRPILFLSRVKRLGRFVYLPCRTIGILSHISTNQILLSILGYISCHNRGSQGVSTVVRLWNFF